jgi:hypothetical protein
MFTIAENNTSAVYATTTNLNLFVSPDGDDTNDGLASGHSLKTIQAAIDKIPQIINGYAIINVSPGTYDESPNITGFSGKGQILLNGDSVLSDSRIVNAISIWRNSVPISVTGFRLMHTINPSLKVQTSQYVELSYCKTIETDEINPGIQVAHSNCLVYNCLISNKIVGISASSMGTILSWNNTGIGNNYALYCDKASKIGKKDTQPSGEIAEFATGGGEIVGN